MNVLVLTLATIVAVGVTAAQIGGLFKGAGRPSRTRADSPTVGADGGGVWFGGWSDGGGCGDGGGGGGDGGGC